MDKKKSKIKSKPLEESVWLSQFLIKIIYKIFIVSPCILM